MLGKNSCNDNVIKFGARYPGYGDHEHQSAVIDRQLTAANFLAEEVVTLPKSPGEKQAIRPKAKRANLYVWKHAEEMFRVYGSYNRHHCRSDA